jgi:hypothetical protein
MAFTVLSRRLAQPAFSSSFPPVRQIQPLKPTEKVTGATAIAVHLEAAMKPHVARMPWVSQVSVVPSLNQPGGYVVQAHVGAPQGPLVIKGQVHPPVHNLVALKPSERLTRTGAQIERWAQRLVKQWQTHLNAALKSS